MTRQGGTLGTAPEPTEEERDSLAVACPKCGASVHQWCLKGRNENAAKIHRPRVAAWRRDRVWVEP